MAIKVDSGWVVLHILEFCCTVHVLEFSASSLQHLCPCLSHQVMLFGSSHLVFVTAGGYGSNYDGTGENGCAQKEMSIKRLLVPKFITSRDKKDTCDVIIVMN